MSTLPMKETPRVLAFAILGMRVLLAGMFAYAAVPKLMDPRAFAEAIANYHLVSDNLSSYTAAILPVLELVVVVGLLVPSHSRGSALVAGLMLAVFAVAMISTIWRGIDLDCGCFGASVDAQIGWPTVARNLVLILMAAVVVRYPAVPFHVRAPAPTHKQGA